MGKRVVQVACASYHTAAITSTGELLTFGWGPGGQLGHGSTRDELVPRRVDVGSAFCDDEVHICFDGLEEFIAAQALV